MFELYYSNKKLTEEKVQNAVELFAEIYRIKNFTKEDVRGSGVLGRVDRFFGNIKSIFVRQINDNISRRHDVIERKIRTEEREERELLAWVRKAVSLGHDREKVFSLLNDGKRSRKEMERILNIYDKEAGSDSYLKKPVHFYNKEGIAQRIVQKERARFEEEVPDY